VAALVAPGNVQQPDRGHAGHLGPDGGDPRAAHHGQARLQHRAQIAAWSAALPQAPPPPGPPRAAAHTQATNLRRHVPPRPTGQPLNNSSPLPARDPLSGVASGDGRDPRRRQPVCVRSPGTRRVRIERSQGGARSLERRPIRAGRSGQGDGQRDRAGYIAGTGSFCGRLSEERQLSALIGAPYHRADPAHQRSRPRRQVSRRRALYSTSWSENRSLGRACADAR
jgi:hypothetical protein